MIAIAAPSGTGKTSIVKNLINSFKDEVVLSVSATTRAKRANEIDGVDYYFFDLEKFQKEIEADNFIEWEKIYGDYYGTLKSETEKLILYNKLIIFELDVKGCLSLKKVYPEAILIFILPPSLEALEYRLRNRKTEDEETIKVRLARAKMEIEQAKYFDYKIVNDNFERACEEVKEIVRRILKNNGDKYVSKTS